MPNTNLLALAASTLLLLIKASRVSAEGCYTDGSSSLFSSPDAAFTFSYLHADPLHWNTEDYVTHVTQKRDLRQEVINDINTQCTILINSIFHGHGSAWSKCTDWAYKKPDETCADVDCFDQCGDKDEEDGERASCFQSCVETCPTTDVDPGDSIAWAIKYDGDGDEDRTLSYDVYNTVFDSMQDDCETGGERTSEGFWFRLDPNVGSCDGRRV